MSAFAIGVFFDVSEIDIVTAISNYQPDNNRSQIKVIDSNTFIMDAYNANPSSLTLAIQNFGNSTEQNKILIIGGMREMGDYSHEVHQDILNVIRQFKFDKIVLVGKEFESMLHENEGLYFLDSRSARDWWRQAGIKNHYILLKGSRGIALEKILE
jgi:UDP-N-acetylmuramoyl-tripeptide--D-alanyl-D-alanine ligase